MGDKGDDTRSWEMQTADDTGDPLEMNAFPVRKLASEPSLAFDRTPTVSLGGVSLRTFSTEKFAGLLCFDPSFPRNRGDIPRAVPTSLPACSRVSSGLESVWITEGGFWMVCHDPLLSFSVGGESALSSLEASQRRYFRQIVEGTVPMSVLDGSCRCVTWCSKKSRSIFSIVTRPIHTPRPFTSSETLNTIS